MTVKQVAAAMLVAGALSAPAIGPAWAQIQLTPQVTRQSPVTEPTRRGAPRGDAAQGDRRGQQTDRRGRRGQPPATPDDAAAARPAGNFPQRLDQRALRARFFDGRPFQARSLGGALFTIVFHADGRMERTDAQGNVTAARWRFQGDAYCSRPENSRAETCYTVVQDGQLVKVVRTTRAVATWSREGAPPNP